MIDGVDIGAVGNSGHEAELLRRFLVMNKEAPGGLRDALDNTGAWYQSAGLAAWLVDARSLAGLRQAPAVQPGGDLVPHALVLAMEDFINEPPRIYDIEPMEVREYRHQAYRVWSPLCGAILQANRRSKAPATPQTEAEEGA